MRLITTRDRNAIGCRRTMDIHINHPSFTKDVYLKEWPLNRSSIIVLIRLCYNLGYITDGSRWWKGRD